MHDLGFTPHDAKLADLPAEMRKIAQASITFGWQELPVRLIIIASAIQTFFLYWAFYAWPPYFLDLLGQDLTWVAGVIAALISLATVAGNSIVEWLTRYCGKRSTLLLWAIGVQAVATVIVGLVGSFWLAVIFFLIAMATTGVWQPVKQAYMHQIIPSEQRATVVSFESLVGTGASVFGQVGLGRLSQTQSIPFAYVTAGFTTVPYAAS